ncbi:MAG: type II toxin-antitoxin system HicA family toxin [bacterium]|nr:type II toxin-antitoxin system HicA family toxin [bacterium]
MKPLRTFRRLSPCIWRVRTPLTLPRLRRLSGDQVVAILARFGFMVHSQRGSHVKLRRVTTTGSVPVHCGGRATKGVL